MRRRSSAEDYVANIQAQADQFGGVNENEMVLKREECNDCGRRFSAEALQRHSTICKKVFGDKREVFDIQQQRADEQALKARRASDPKIEALLQKQREEGSKKWRVRSDELRKSVKSSKQMHHIDQKVGKLAIG